MIYNTIIALFSVLFLFSPKLMIAQSPTPIKSNGLTIDKKVRPFDNNLLDNNIEANKKIFKNNDLVVYSVEVKNVSQEDLKEIEIKDYMGNYLTPVLYTGQYSQADKNIIWKIDLKKGESKTYTIRAKISSNDGQNRKIENQVEARKNNYLAKDTSYIYSGVALTPKTGPEDQLLVGTGVGVSLILAAWILRKKIRGF